jgi:hypothetical protein
VSRLSLGGSVEDEMEAFVALLENEFKELDET